MRLSERKLKLQTLVKEREMKIEIQKVTEKKKMEAKITE